MKLTKALLLILPLALTTSCMVGPNYRTPDAKVEQQWTYGPGASSKQTNRNDASWWKTFRDPVLNNLIEVAYRNNLTQQIAGVRILQARAQLNATIGNLFPQQQNISGALNYTKVSTPDRLASFTGATNDFAMDQVLFSSSWEIDFWGKFRRNIQSEQATYLGTVASYDDAMVTLIADVASSYVNIRTAEERIRVAQQNAESQKESHRVAVAQFTSGETSQLDEQQAATLLAQTEAQVPRLQNTLNQAKTGLAVLLGETPDKVDRYLAGSSRIPVSSTGVAAGIPRDLLRRRPDVRVAGLNAAAQSALIGVSRANMLPALSLFGAFGFSSNNAAKEFAGGYFHVAKQRGAGRGLPTLAGLQLRPVDQSSAGAGCSLSAGGTELSKHGAERAAGRRERPVRLLHGEKCAGQPDHGRKHCSSCEPAFADPIQSRRDGLHHGAKQRAGAVERGGFIGQLARQRSPGIDPIYRALGGGWEIRKEVT